MAKEPDNNNNDAQNLNPTNGLGNFFTDLDGTTNNNTIGRELAGQAGLHNAEQYLDTVNSDAVKGMSLQEAATTLKNAEAAQLAELIEQDESDADNAAPLNPQELTQLRKENIENAMKEYRGLSGVELRHIQSELPEGYKLSGEEIARIENRLTHEYGATLAENFTQTGNEAVYVSAAEEYAPTQGELEQQRLAELQQRELEQQQLALQQEQDLDQIRREQELNNNQNNPTPGMNGAIG